MRSEKKIRDLTKNQAVMLKSFITTLSPSSGASGLPGPINAGVVTSLRRKGYIAPLGRDGRNKVWEIVDTDIQNDINEEKGNLLDLLNRITGGKDE